MICILFLFMFNQPDYISYSFCEGYKIHVKSGNSLIIKVDSIPELFRNGIKIANECGRLVSYNKDNYSFNLTLSRIAPIEAYCMKSDSTFTEKIGYNNLEFYRMRNDTNSLLVLFQPLNANYFIFSRIGVKDLVFFRELVGYIYLSDN